MAVTVIPAGGSTTPDSEARLQGEMVMWFWNTYPEERRMLHHNDNNSWNAVIGAKKKALGVVDGPSDLELIASKGRTIFIEVKTPTGTQSPAQKDFMDKVIARGHVYVIVRTLEQFKELVWAVIGKK